MNNKVLFNIEYGLYLLSVNNNEKDNACIINTVIQVTSEPLQIAICVNKNNYTTEVLRQNKKFNLSILTQDTTFETIKRFGYQSGRDKDKFIDFSNTKRSNNGLIYLTKEANSYISAFVKQEIELETHIMFIAQIIDMQVLTDTKTLTYDYYQNNIKPQNKPTDKKGWRCKICGYIYEHEFLPPDYICPICKHGAVDFEKI